MGTSSPLARTISNPGQRNPSEQLLRPERTFECRHHAVASERVLVAEKAHHSLDVAAAGFHVIVLVYVRLEIDLPEPIEIGTKRVANLRRHVLDCAVSPHERQRLLRSDPFDARMKIGPDEQTQIDQLRARNSQ